jgi:hypothetical protein
MEVYRHSGAVPLGGALTTLATGAVAAAVLGVLYAIGISYIPLIYVNVFLTLALGMSIGAVVAWSSKRSGIRSNAAIIALSILAGLVGLYLAWAGTLLVLSGWRSGLILQPIKLGRFAIWLYHNGWWVLSNGKTVKGIPLALVWLGEAGIVLCTAVSMAKGAIRDAVFCESCLQWCKVGACLLRVQVDPDEDQDLLNRLSAGDLAALDEMPTVTDDAACCVQVDLTSCPMCQRTNYLSMRIVRQGYRSNGEFHVYSEPLVTNRAISERDVELIRDIARAANEEEPAGEDEEASE